MNPCARAQVLYCRYRIYHETPLGSCVDPCLVWYFVLICVCAVYCKVSESKAGLSVPRTELDSRRSVWGLTGLDTPRQ